MRKILIVHNYFGPRRVFLKPYVEDPLFLVKKQIQYLEEVKHDLNHVIFTVNRRGVEDDENVSSLRQLFPEKFQKATTEILVRENVGLSYGAFSDVYAKYRRQYDYYFFTEDDYLFCENWFDSILIDMLTENENPGYLCGLVWILYGPGYEHGLVHAGNSVGVASSTALEDVYTEKNEIPHLKTVSSYETQEGICSQVLHTNSIYEKGYSLTDISTRYTMYHTCPGGIEHHFANNTREIITPIQRTL